MGKSIEQSAGVTGSGTSIQVAGNYQHGLTYGEVKDLMELLWEANFPKLTEAATERASQSVQRLIEQTYAKLNEKVDRISAEKLAEPDVQQVFNSAVQGAARKGEKANIDLLANLLEMRVERDNSDFLDICIEEAVSIVPKLTPEMIGALVTVQFVKHLTVSDGIGLEQMYVVIYQEYASKCREITLTRSRTIASFGAGTYMNIMGSDTLSTFKAKYPTLNSQSDIEAAFPSLVATLRLYDEKQLHKLDLSVAGKVIALTLLRRHFPVIDPKALID